LLTPPTVVTVIGTVPVPAGATAVIWVAETTVNDVAAVAPKLTPVAPVNPAPVNVTDVPPLTSPETGKIEINTGTGTYVKETPLLTPPTVVTVIGTVPVPAGATAVIWVAETTVNDVAAVAPKSTAVAPVNPVPVNVTDVPPVTGPETGNTEANTGTGTYVKEIPLLTPPTVVTVTGTVPVPAGATAVTCVSETTVNDVAAVAPKLTPVAVDSPVPVRVTVVPPITGPETGKTEVKTGTWA